MRATRLPTVDELQAFVASVDRGSLTKAAAELHISTTAIAKRLRNLEVVTGLTLLERRPQGVRPTKAGSLLYPKARAILRRFEEIRYVHQELTSSAELESLRSIVSAAGESAPAEVLLAQVELLTALLIRTTSDAVALFALEDGDVLASRPSEATLRGASHGFRTRFGGAAADGARFGDLGEWADEPERRRTTLELLSSGRAETGGILLRAGGLLEPVRAVLFLMHLGSAPYVLVRLLDSAG